MAESALDTRKRLYQDVFGRALRDDELGGLGGAEGLEKKYGPNSEAAQLKELTGSAEYAQRAKDKAAGLYGTGRDLSLNQLALNEQGIGQQETDITRNFDRLGQTLRENATASSRGLEERYNELGLLQSGRTAAGLGKIQSDLNLNLGRSEEDRASNLAKLALQRAGLGIQRQQVQNQYQTSVDDYVGQIMAGGRQRVAQAEEQERQRQAQERQDYLTKLELAQSIPYGQSMEVPGLGVIEGTGSAELREIDLGNKVVLVDSSGNIVQEYGKGKLPGVGRSNSTTRSLGGTTFRQAYDDAALALQAADVLNNSNADQLLSTSEEQIARDEVDRIANLYGVDPDELWNQLMQDYGYGSWTGPENPGSVKKSLPAGYTKKKSGGSDDFSLDDA